MADVPLHVLDMAHGLTHSSPGRKPTGRLVNASDELIRTTKDVEEQASLLKSMILTDGTRPGSKVSTMSMLNREANQLTKCIKEIQSSLRAAQEHSEAYIIAQIMHLGEADHPSMDVQCILRHHREDIRAIVQKHLDNDSYTDEHLWKIVEECYTQSVKSKGSLRSIPTRVGSSELEMHQRWIAFWRRALHKCPGGPTLFWPWMKTTLQGKPIAPPKYLFRAFDSSSCGKSNDTVVASPASLFMAKGESRTDIRSLGEQDGTDKLHLHCNGQHKARLRADDLMSWSSSFVFVIQLAIYMHNVTGHRRDAVQILAVDTTKFPPGQFARDLDLFEVFQSAENGVQSMKTLVEWRTSGAFDNGEYFSQGLLNHKGRSCVTSLGKLVDSGLFDLHPDFDVAHGARKWTTRVKQLRRMWEVQHETHRFEVEWAFDIASKCFPGFKKCELAMLLLMFVNRGRLADGNNEASLRAMKQYGPLEVQRYLVAIKRFRNEFRGTATGLEDLKGFFGCQERAVEALTVQMGYFHVL